MRLICIRCRALMRCPPVIRLAHPWMEPHKRDALAIANKLQHCSSCQTHFTAPLTHNESAHCMERAAVRQWNHTEHAVCTQALKTCSSHSQVPVGTCTLCLLSGNPADAGKPGLQSLVGTAAAATLNVIMAPCCSHLARPTCLRDTVLPPAPSCLPGCTDSNRDCCEYVNTHMHAYRRSA